MSDRAVSVTLDYIIMLMIATIVLASVASISASLIDDQVERGVQDELEVIGESLAADIQDVERLVNTDDNGSTIELESAFPRVVSGENYVFHIDGDSNTIILASSGAGVEVTTPVATDRLDGSDSAIRGGPVLITAANGTIEVSPA